MEIPELLVIWATVIGGIWGLFNAMEESSNRKFKTKVSEWLKNLAKESSANLIKIALIFFIKSFDRIFGEKHLSFKCFFRSCVASLLAVLIVSIIYFASNRFEIQKAMVWHAPNGLSYISYIFILTLFLNFIPDYISLLETRWILKKAVGVRIGHLALLLLLDIIFTYAIFYFSTIIIIKLYFLLLFKTFLTYAHPELIPIRAVNAFPEFLFLKKFDFMPGSIGIFFYSAFFTSIWLYLFIISAALIKVSHPILLARYMNNFLDIGKKPLSSMGTVLMIFFSLSLLIFLIIKYVFSIFI